MNESEAEIRRQILDENKRVWWIGDYHNDRDLFFTNVVKPLRKLRDQGTIQKLDELSLHIDGDPKISQVEIIGAVDIDEI